jgi:peptidyl-prolyl cis-trans isomerase C
MPVSGLRLAVTAPRRLRLGHRLVDRLVVVGLASLLVVTLVVTSVRAQTQTRPAPGAAPGAAMGAGPAAGATAGALAPDPIVAKVNGQPIHLSDLESAAKELPPNARKMAPATLYPMLLEQIIDGQALSIEARKAGLQSDPAVEHQIAAATDRVLQTAMLGKVIGPTVTEEALHARYQRDFAAKPAEDEVHARHILVDNEELAKKIIVDLKKGGDFAALAKEYSKDPGSDHSGDLGFFRQDEMVPEFAAAAFAMKPNQISDTPVHTQFGWHVIEVLERRHADPPSFEQEHDELRQKVVQEGVQKALAEARSQVVVEKFNLDGSSQRATDTAEPPPAEPPPAKP